MRGLTSPLWPIRYKPLPDELLSCWLVRLAHGHGLKVQTFCNLIFGNRLQVWNRDIDRTAPSWLLDEISYRTGTSADLAWNTTLRAYEGLLYRTYRLSSTMQWMLSLKIYHRKREGYGLQFCPACLKEDAIPYFRKCWRVAFNTVCSRHRTMLHDRCPKCSASVAFHRIDMRNLTSFELAPLSYCHSCGFDLRDAPTEEPISYDRQASALLLEANRALDGAKIQGEWDLGRYSVMHHLSTIMTAQNKHLKLRDFVLNQVGFPDMSLTEGRLPFEMRPISERHHLMQLIAWLLVSFEFRLTVAWCARAIRYNVLVKDFDERPDWYNQIAGKLVNWRDRLNVCQ